MSEKQNKKEETKEVQKMAMIVKLPKELKENIKKEHAEHTNKLRLLEIPVNDDHLKFIEVAAIVPSRSVTSQYMKWSDQNPKKAQDILLKNCLLTGWDIIKDDDFMANTAVDLVAELIPMGQGKIKKF